MKKLVCCMMGAVWLAAAGPVNAAEYPLTAKPKMSAREALDYTYQRAGDAQGQGAPVPPSPDAQAGSAKPPREDLYPSREGESRQSTRLTYEPAPASTPTPGWSPAPAKTAPPASEAPAPAGQPQGYRFNPAGREPGATGRSTRVRTYRDKTPVTIYAPGQTPTPGWSPAPDQAAAAPKIPQAAPSGPGYQAPAPVAQEEPPARSGRETRSATRLTYDSAPAPAVRGATPTPGWSPEPAQVAPPAPVPTAQAPAEPGSRSRRAAQTATRLEYEPAPAVRGAAPTPGWSSEPAQAAVTPAAPVGPSYRSSTPGPDSPPRSSSYSRARRDAEPTSSTRLTVGSPQPVSGPPSAAQAGREARRSRVAVPAAPEQAAAEPVLPRGGRAAQPKQTRLTDSNKILVPATGVAPAALAQEMDQSYQLFDTRYQDSLGKTRKELKDLWGFPMETMGQQQSGELAVGFRQRGTIIKPETPTGAAQKASYYASTNTVAQVSENVSSFACLVVLWIDQNGEGRVVDGDAVGDCFIPESLRNVPVKFER